MRSHASDAHSDVDHAMSRVWNEQLIGLDKLSQSALLKTSYDRRIEP